MARTNFFLKARSLTTLSESWASQTEEIIKNIAVKRSALAEALFWKQFDGQVLMYEQLDRAKSSDIMGILATPLPPPEIWTE